MKIKLFSELEPTYRYLKKDQNGREINIYNLSNCYLTGYSLYYPNVLILSEDQYILPVNERTMSLDTTTKYESENMVYKTYESLNSYQNVEDPVFFFIYNTDNYYHFIYDTLPYLISYFYLKKTVPNLKLLMNYPGIYKKEMYLFVKEFLELLDVDFIICDEKHHYRTIYISTSYTHAGLSNMPPRQEIYDFYQRMVDIAKKKYNGSLINMKNIYISRRTWIHNDLSNIGTNYTTRRKMVNEDELVKVLVGYTEVFTEKLSTIEKIIVFSQADNIIGAIGGGMTNLLFAKKDTRAIVIVSPYFLEINGRFRFSMDHTKVVYYNDTKIDSVINGLSKYMRVKVKEMVIGEIVELEEDRVKVALGDGTNTGWNSENKYTEKYFKYNEVSKVDNGLNSPYSVKIQGLIPLLTTTM